MTDWALLRCVGRINIDYRNTGNIRLVVDKLSELVEAPRAMPISLSLLNRCPLSNVLEIFKCNQRRGVYGFHDKLLGDAMVGISLEPCFMTRKFLQMAFGRLCTFALEICLEVSHFGSNFLNLLTREYFACGIDRNILDSEIYSENVLGNTLLRHRNIYHNAEIEVPSLIEEVGLPSDPIKPWSMVAIQDNGYFDSALKSQQRNTIKSLPRHDALVIDYRAKVINGWLDGLISLVGFTSLRDCPDGHLCRDAKLLTNITINDLLQFDFVGCTKLKGFLSHVIAGGIELMHSLKERPAIFNRCIQFDFESLHHCIEHIDLWKHKGCAGGFTAFLPGPKGRASCLIEVNITQFQGRIIHDR